jgi:hypothetical protein
MTSARVSATLPASQLGDLHAVGRTFLFFVLKTGNAWLIAAALVCPTKLADRDA